MDLRRTLLRQSAAETADRSEHASCVLVAPCRAAKEMYDVIVFDEAVTHSKMVSFDEAYPDLRVRKHRAEQLLGRFEAVASADNDYGRKTRVGCLGEFAALRSNPPLRL